MPLDESAIEGFIAPEVREELPGLRLLWAMLDRRPRPDRAAIRERLRSLSDRVHGADVVAMRTRPVHHAYRAFYRQTGLDPDVQRTPAEQAALSRLLHGTLGADDDLGGALLIALVETGVPVWALTGDSVAPSGLGIRQTHERDTLGQRPLGPGRLVVADERAVHALLFDQPVAGHRASRDSSRVALFAVGVSGVSDMHLIEALWLAAGALGA